jgi:hypothetical protein
MSRKEGHAKGNFAAYADPRASSATLGLPQRANVN